jgi:hypothetical protein
MKVIAMAVDIQRNTPQMILWFQNIHPPRVVNQYSNLN